MFLHYRQVCFCITGEVFCITGDVFLYAKDHLSVAMPMRITRCRGEDQIVAGAKVAERELQPIAHTPLSASRNDVFRCSSPLWKRTLAEIPALSSLRNSATLQPNYSADFPCGNFFRTTGEIFRTEERSWDIDVQAGSENDLL